jgi:UDP-glucose 4-epimerase
VISFGKVVVTGGGGFIGSYLVRALKEMAVSVHVVDDFSSGFPVMLLSGNAVRVHRCSVLEREPLAAILGNSDLIIHLAGIPGTRLETEERDLALKTALEGTRNIIELSGGTPVLIFSSAAVYGPGNGRSFLENDVVSYEDALAFDNGIPGYACGKYHMEQLAVDESLTGRPVMIIRPFNIIGPGQSARHGGVIPSFFERAFQGSPLLVRGGRQAARYFSDVEIFVDCLLKLIKAPGAWRPPTNVINVGASQKTRIIEIARKIIEMTGSKSPILFDEELASHIHVETGGPSIDRLYSLIGHVAWPSIESVLRKIFESDYRKARGTTK